MKALIVVDMLEDFIDGALANPQAERIIEPLSALLAHARQEGWVVVFSNDAHEQGDPELAIWGEHAMAGTPGARVISALEPHPGPTELIAPKRTYGAFDGTDLDERLRMLGVSEIILTGQHTNICVRHSAYGAFRHGFDITVARDAVCALEGVDEQEALDYLEHVYGATIASVEQVMTAEAHVGAPD